MAVLVCALVMLLRTLPCVLPCQRFDCGVCDLTDEPGDDSGAVISGQFARIGGHICINSHNGFCILRPEGHIARIQNICLSSLANRIPYLHE